MMGKSRKRRVRNREKYFADLARKDTDRFCIEWDKRVASALHEIHGRSHNITTRSPSAFSLIDDTLKTLRVVSEEMFSLYGRNTQSELSAEYVRAMRGK